MSEDEAQHLVEERFGPMAMDRLRRFVALLATENERQNLVSSSSLSAVWSRHILDSVQLVAFAGDGIDWLDIGSGGGFPGLVVAAIDGRPMTLVEPRRRRATFLSDVATALSLRHVEVLSARIENVERQASIISARAVASPEKLLHAARHCATSATRWLLPRGRLSPGELHALGATGVMFHVEQSLSDDRSSVLVGQGAPTWS